MDSRASVTSQGSTGDVPEVVLSPPADSSPDESFAIREDMSDDGLSVATQRRSRHQRHRNPRRRKIATAEATPEEVFDMASVSMPTTAPAAQAQQARSKLDRLERSRMQKRAWLRYSGVSAAITAGELINAPDTPDERQSHRASLTPSDLMPPSADDPSSPISPDSDEFNIPAELLDGDWNDDSNSDSMTSELSDESDSSRDEPSTPTMPSQLSLHHNCALTNKQMRKHLRRLRNVPPELRRHYHLGHNSLNRVSHGLHYASRSSRMHRAMVKYTPNAGELVSSRTSVDQTGDSCVMNSQDPDMMLSPSVSASPRGSVTMEGSGTSDTDASEQYLSADARPHGWHRRKKKAWNNAPAPEAEMSRFTQPRQSVLTTSDFNTSSVQLAGAAEEQAPTGTLVYDVLYENERGAALFGVSKHFSKYMLSALDPSPWSDANGANTALTPGTMQLPDPSWSWVHPEWLVDMSGETDEDGWQYSGSFTGLKIWNRPVHFSNTRTMGRWVQGAYDYMRERSERRSQQQRSKLRHREDTGLESLMRTMRIRTAHWRGVPSMWTFVRRRRWVRLRRKVTDVLPAATLQQSMRPSTDTDGAAGDASDSSDDDDDAAGAASRQARRQIQHELKVAHVTRMLHALLPLFILKPAQVHELRRRLSDKDPLAPFWSEYYWLTLSAELSVQNPFVEYSWVQSSLERDDLAFIVNPIRAAERRYKRESVRQDERLGVWANAPIRPLERTRSAEGEAAHTIKWEPPVDIVRAGPALIAYANGADGMSLVREAVIDLNMTQLREIMKASANDHVKLELWKIWLGIEQRSEEKDYNFDALQHEWSRHWRRLAEMKKASAMDIPPSLQRAIRVRTYNRGAGPPTFLDVWDILVVYLDDVIGMLDHESTRLSLVQYLRMLQDATFMSSTADERGVVTSAATSICIPCSDSRLHQAGGAFQLPPLPLLPRDV